MKCKICGRNLRKSEGPVGPSCLKKLYPKEKRNNYKSDVISLLKYDIFKEECHGQKIAS